MNGMPMLPWNINHPRFGLSESVLKREPLHYEHWSSVLVPGIEFKFTHLTLVLLVHPEETSGPERFGSSSAILAGLDASMILPISFVSF